MDRLDSSLTAPQDVVDVTDTARRQVPQGSGSNGGQAGSVRDEAMGQARAVASAAREETKGVLSDLGDEISRQASEQKQRLSQGLQDVSMQLDEAAANGSGQVSRLASEAAQRTRAASEWLERNEPRDLIDAVEDFGRRRPMTFLAISALAGAVVGRLTRGMVDDARESQSWRQGTVVPATSTYVANPALGASDPYGVAGTPSTSGMAPTSGPQANPSGLGGGTSAPMGGEYLGEGLGSGTGLSGSAGIDPQREGI